MKKKQKKEQKITGGNEEKNNEKNQKISHKYIWGKNGKVKEKKNKVGNLPHLHPPPPFSLYRE